MKKLLLILLFVFAKIFLFGQIAKTPGTASRANSSVIVEDYNLSARANFLIPRFTDTTQANTYNKMDTCGKIIYTYSGNQLLLRACNPKRWVSAVGSGSITSFNFLTDSSLIICYGSGVCDTIAFENNVFVTQTTFDSTINNITNITIGCNYVFPNGLLVSYDSLLVFSVTAGTANINCNSYTYGDTTITLTNGDVTFPRFDVIAVDTNGHIVVIAGTPAADPQIPQTDPASQVALTTILVNAGATTPADIVVTLPYDENIEWVFATNGWTNSVPANPNDISNPYHLSKDIAVSNSGTVSLLGAYITLTAPDTLYFNEGYSLLKLFLKLNFSFNPNQGLKFTFYFNGSQVSNAVAFINGQLGFDRTNTTTYQNITIPFGLFIPTDTAFNQLLIQPVNSAKGFLLDYIQLQQGFGASDVFGNFIQNQNSADQLANFRISGIGRAVTFTSPGTSSSEKFGFGSTASNGGNAFGYGANGTNQGVAIGINSVANNSIAIGNYVTALSGSIVAGHGGTHTGTGVSNFGLAITSTAGNQVNLGQGHVNSAVNAHTLGYYNRLSGTYDIAIGNLDTIEYAHSYAFGNLLRPTASYQMLIGSGDRNSALGLTDVYFGSGVVNPLSGDFSVNITGEEGTDISGHSLTMKGGAGTGSAATGSIVNLATSDATGSGTTAQTFTNKLQVLQSGQITFNKYIPGTFDGGSSSDSVLVITSAGLVKKRDPSAFGATITASNGLTKTVNDIALGGTLTGNTTIATGANTLTISTSTGSVNPLKVTSTTGNYSIWAEATTGTGVLGYATGVGNGVVGQSDGGGNGVAGVSSSASGVSGTTNTGTGVVGLSNGSGIPATFSSNSSSNSVVVSLLHVTKQSSSGGGANGIGGSIDYYLENATVSTNLSNQLISKWTDAALATRTSQFIITGVNSAVTADLFTLSGSGATRFNKYGIGTFTGTPTYTLQVDASGNIIEGASVPGGAITASNGLTRTVNDIALGGTLTGNTTITNAGGLSLTVESVSGTALTGSSSVSGTGLSGTSVSGTGLHAFSNSGLAAFIRTNPSSTNTAISLMEIRRQTTGTAANGIGSMIEFSTQTTSPIATANQLISKWTDATSATRTSQFIITGVNSAISADLFTLSGNGGLKLNKYGINTFTGTPTYGLAVDADGDVIEVANGGGVYTASNGLTMTANNTVLGGTLTGNTTITSNTFSLTFAGGATSTPVNITSASDGAALYITQAGGGATVGNGITVAHTSANGSAIYGSTSGAVSAISGYASVSGIGVDGLSLSGLGGRFIAYPSSTNTVVPVVRIGRQSSGASSDGIGGSVDFYNQVHTSSQQRISNQLISKFTTDADATRTSQFIITGVNSATTDDLLKMGDYVTLTEATATTFATTTIPTSKIGGGEIVVTVTADDATDFQARTLRLIWTAVNKAGTTTITISTPEEVVAASTGTLTATITAVDAGSGVINFKADATSSLTQTTLRCSYQMYKNF